MPEHQTEAEPSNLNLSSILLAVFKRKKTILISTAAGAIAAAAVYLLWPHSYESDAALLVRYVLDRSAVDPESREVVWSDQLRPKPTTPSLMPKSQF